MLHVAVLSKTATVPIRVLWNLRRWINTEDILASIYMACFRAMPIVVPAFPRYTQFVWIYRPEAWHLGWMYSSVCYTYLRNNCWTVCPVTDMNLDYTRQISAANNCVRCLLSDLLHFDLTTILCDIGRCLLQYWLTQQKLGPANWFCKMWTRHWSFTVVKIVNFVIHLEFGDDAQSKPTGYEPWTLKEKT